MLSSKLLKNSSYLKTLFPFMIIFNLKCLNIIKVVYIYFHSHHQILCYFFIKEFNLSEFCIFFILKIKKYFKILFVKITFLLSEYIKIIMQK